MHPEYLLVVADSDPVARRVLHRWGVPPSTGEFVDGSPIRRLSEQALLLHRPGPHVRDDRLDERLPADLTARRIPLVFPSIHRSESGTACFTVHALGNPTTSAELGGEPARLTPSDPPRMTAVLRALDEGGAAIGLPSTFESTHHGPILGHPAFFAEIGFGDRPSPPEAAVDVLARALSAILPASDDRVAVGLGGGHYAPHFTELALERRWAFGHILSRHALPTVTEEVARAAWDGSPGAVGWLCSRAQDYATGPWSGIGPRARDPDAPRRGPGRSG